MEETDKRLRKLEDKEITRLYNESYSAPEIVAQDIELSEEMLEISAVHEMEEKC